MAVDKPWCVYLLVCQGGGLYTGITPDLEKRFTAHQQGRGSFYTRLNPPEAILGQLWLVNRHEAAVLERRVKRLSAADKDQWLVALPVTSPSSPTTLEALRDMPFPTGS
jgi:putative endonuclease